jgi:HK97 family phage major capsid protein
MKKWIKLLKDYKGHKAGEQIEVDGEVADLLVETKSAEVCDNPTKDAVTEAAKKFQETLEGVADKAAASVIEKLAIAGKNAKGKGENRPNITITTHDNALDDPKMGFKSASQFFLTAACASGMAFKGGMDHAEAKEKIYGKDGYIAKVEAVQKAATGQSEAIDSEGGVFVVPEFSNELMLTQAQLAGPRKYCRKFTMNALNYQVRARVDKDHTSSVAGGITVSRKQEAVSPTLSKAKFEWITFKATRLTGYTALTDEVMADASAFATLFPGFFAEAMDSQEEADFFFKGTGAGEPLAAFHANNPSLISITKDTNQAAGTVSLNNILNMRSRAYGYGNPGTVWVASQDIIPQLATLVIGTIPVWQPSMKEDIADRLLGAPLVFSEHAATAGTMGDLNLLIGSEYAIADRTGMESASSMHVLFLTNETAIKFWKRNDGQPLWRAALTPKAGNTRSPFINIATRS